MKKKSRSELAKAVEAKAKAKKAKPTIESDRIEPAASEVDTRISKTIPWKM